MGKGKAFIIIAICAALLVLFAVALAILITKRKKSRQNRPNISVATKSPVPPLTRDSKVTFTSEKLHPVQSLPQAPMPQPSAPPLPVTPASVGFNDVERGTAAPYPEVDRPLSPGIYPSS